MSEKKGTDGGVVELLTVVTLHGFNHGAELSSDIRKKVRMCSKSVRLKT